MILTMFFSREVALKDWEDTGILDREKLIYEEHLKRGNLTRVHWITYGARDGRLAKRLRRDGRLHPEIQVHGMPWIFKLPLVGSWIYSFLAPFIHSGPIRESDLLKTNQVSGSWTALVAKKRTGKPMIMRCGYIASLFAWKRKGLGIGARLYEIAERRGFHNAEAGIVASFEDRRFLMEKYAVPPEKINVLYNYIDTSLFKPLPGRRRPDRLCFVGKLRKQKNVEALIQAAARLNMPLDIYGDGSLRPRLEALALELGANAAFHGMVANADLPRILADYRYYVLPSFYEGTPKTLLEAMACGLVCIGCNVVGVNEILVHGENGFLSADTSPEAVAQAVAEALTADADDIGRKALETIERQFSLHAWADREYELMLRIAPPSA